MYENGIVDPASVKIYALKAAGEAAEAILRIDTIIKKREEKADTSSDTFKVWGVTGVSVEDKNSSLKKGEDNENSTDQDQATQAQATQEQEEQGFKRRTGCKRRSPRTSGG